jgi:hypothetical protein
MKLLKMLSNTEHYNLGQYNGSFGKGIVNLIIVFIVGSAPAGPGYVLMFSIFLAQFGGTKLLRLNYIKAFLTGKIPTDYKPLSPRIEIST